MHSNSTKIESLPLPRAAGLVLVNDTPKGRGVFATLPIPRSTMIDISPVLIFTPDEVDQHTSHTCLAHYTFTWPYATISKSTSKSTIQSQAIALGLGSMFNHSRLHQNVGWKRDFERGVIVYSAIRDIEAGEELCINYGGKLWFDDVEGEIESEDDESVDELGRSGLGAIELVDEDEKKGEVEDEDSDRSADASGTEIGKGT